MVKKLNRGIPSIFFISDVILLIENENDHSLIKNNQTGDILDINDCKDILNYVYNQEEKRKGVYRNKQKNYSFYMEGLSDFLWDICKFQEFDTPEQMLLFLATNKIEVKDD